MGVFKDCGCGCKGKKQFKKFILSLISALVFFIVASPETFIIVRRLFGQWVSSPNGCPSTYGLILHSVVFMLIVWFMMNINRENYMEISTMDEPSADAVYDDTPSADYVPKVTGTVMESPSEEPMDVPTPRLVDSPMSMPKMDTAMEFQPLDMDSQLGSMDLQGEDYSPAPY